MQRVLIIGSSGAGKSTLSRRLGKQLGLPVFHLDQYFWEPGWKQVDGFEWYERNRRLIDADRWILDGNYSSTMNMRSERADTLIFLDLPLWLRLWRIFRRRLRYHGRARPDMTPGCPERITWQFLRYVWRYAKDRRPRIMDHLARCREEGKTVLIFQTRQQIDQWLSGLKEG